MRQSRVIWLLYVAPGLVALFVFPNSPWKFPAYVVTVVTVALLLAPGAVRAVWSGHDAYTAAPDFRRPD